LGQIGSDLVSVLRAKYGAENVIATDIKKPAKASFLRDGPFLYADVVDYNSLAQIVVEHKIDWLIHNSSILSASGERNPQLALEVNVKGIQNALELARNHNLRILAPSTIAVFGTSTPKDNTPDTTIMRPSTVYGLSKVHLELLGEYYFNKYGVDFRSLRYPGVISSEVNPPFSFFFFLFFIFKQRKLLMII
jgi:threonine 3-dehydrogenase